jgi:hypothetical protein
MTVSHSARAASAHANARPSMTSLAQRQEGYCVEKNGRSAYYWLRMAEENSSGLTKRNRSLVAELRATTCSP